MRFDWKKYLELAEYLVQKSDELPDPEACFRSSVSRAYYAAFCITRGYMREKAGKEYIGGDAHSKVREHLKKSGEKLKRTVANQLQGIHFNRIKADYYDNISRENPRAMAYKSVAMAKKIIGEIDELSSRDSR